MVVSRAPLQLVGRSFRWIDLISRTPLVVPADLLALPGIRYVEPDAGHPDPLWKIEIPATTWMLPRVDATLRQFGWRPPASNVLVPSWPGLFNYQQDAVQWAVERQGGLLALSLGLGKTRTSLVTARVLAARYDNKPVLICGPKYVRSTWQREIQAVFGDSGYEFRALTSVKPTLLAVPKVPLFLFCHYDIIHAWWSQIAALCPRVTILDEIHKVGNPRTRRGRAAAIAVSTAYSRIGLTGTPIRNRPSELYPLLNLTAGRFTFGTPYDFRTRYCGAQTGVHGLVDGEPSHVEELHARLSACVLHRTPEDCGLELPPVTRDIVHVDPTEEEQAKYKHAFGDHDPREALEAILGRRASQETIYWLGRLRAVAASIKYRVTQELLDDLNAQGESVVVFSWQRSSARLLAGSNGHVVHGELSSAAREEAIDAFQAKGGRLSATYGALAEGVTLDRARVVVLHDLDYVPANVLQAAGRVSGGLRRRNKHCVEKWMVARGTLDELMIRIIGVKGNAIDTVLADRAAKTLGDFLGYKQESASLDHVITWARSV